MITLLIALSSSLYLIVAGVALVNNRRSLSHLTFAWIAISMAIWAASFIFYETPIIFTHELWIKFIYTLVFSIVGALLYFSYAFPNNKTPPIWMQLLYWTMSAYFLYTLFFTDEFVLDVISSPNGLETRLGNLYPIVIAFYGAFNVPTLLNYIFNYRKSTGSAKLQFLYIFLGLVSFIVVVITLDAVIPLFFGTSKYFVLSGVSSLAFIILSGYAIIRHRLLDIRFALKGVISYILISVFFGALLYGFSLGYWFLTNQPIKLVVLPLTLLAGLIITTFYSRMTALTKHLVDQVIFPSAYDYQLTLRDLSHSLSNILDTQQQVDKVAATITETLQTEKIGVILFTESGSYQVSKLIGFDSEQLVTIANNNPLIETLTKQGRVIVTDESRRGLEEMSPDSDQEKLKDIYNSLLKSTSSLVLPVINKELLVGIIALGPRKNEDAFTVQDINLLNTIAAQFAIALENATLYQEVADANKNLQKKIEDATSELKQKNEAISKALHELESLDDMKNQLISVTSHELKSPATVVQNYLWVVLNSADAGTNLAPTDRQKLERSLVGIKNLIRLINDILNVSRIEGGKLTATLETVDPTPIIEEIVQDYSQKAVEKGLSLEFIKKDQLAPITADKEKFTETLTNLISNAIKYTASGNIAVSVTQDDKLATFCVADTGRGIAQENLSHIFEKFYREDASLSASNPVTGGTGLGLYITKSFIELMNGKIWVETKKDAGSKFFFSLPVAPVAKNESKD